MVAKFEIMGFGSKRSRNNLMSKSYAKYGVLFYQFFRHFDRSVCRRRISRSVTP